jgi:four helix bundle protein
MTHVPEAYATRTFRFACEIAVLYRELRRHSSVPWAVSRQLLRAGTSIGANIEEARAAQSRRDLRSKFAIALKEARETKYWLRLMVATEMVPAGTLASSLHEADELVAILTVSVRRLRDEESGS